jgi:hypothetical protein
MPKKKITFETVRELGLALPGVEEGTAYGSPALKVNGALLACLAVHKSAEPGSLVIRIDFEQRGGLLAEEPGTYYLTDHYVKYPAVLVRLSEIRIDQLRDLLRASWVFVKAQKSRAASRRKVMKGSAADRPSKGSVLRRSIKSIE